MKLAKVLLLILLKGIFAFTSDKFTTAYSSSTYFLTLEDKYLTGFVVEQFESPSLLSCSHSCLRTSWCSSTNFKEYSMMEAGKCELNSHEVLDVDKGSHFQDRRGSRFSILRKDCALTGCLNGGSCLFDEKIQRFTCSCKLPWTGDNCGVNVTVYRSCDELFKAGHEESGVNLIRLNQSEFLRVYCDQQSSKGAGWTMVFKVVSGVVSDIYRLWSSANSFNEYKTEALNVNASLKGHYKNRLVNNWNAVNPNEVRVSLYKDGSEILSMVFDASNSDSENWFSKDRIIYVPWTDLRTEKTNVFDVNVCCGRAFSIFRNYGGCGNDAGWLVITGMNCGWENRFPKTTVMYSKLGSHVDLNDFVNVGVADVFAVFIR